MEESVYLRIIIWLLRRLDDTLVRADHDLEPQDEIEFARLKKIFRIGE